jgi:transposase
VRLHNQLEALLEDGRSKLAALLSDLLGVSGRRMLQALADGQTDPAVLAAMAEPEVRARPEQLADALSAAATLSPLHRRIVGLFLERLQLIEEQIAALHQATSAALHSHQDAVLRLAAVPGLGVDSTQQVIAEVGPEAATFATPGQLASWVGVCPGREESAEVSKSNRSPKGNRAMRRLLNQAANGAVNTKGSALQALYRRLVPRLGHKKAIWAVAHRICLLTWKILRQGVEYVEYGAARDPKALHRRTTKLIRTLRALGYQVSPPPVQAPA